MTQKGENMELHAKCRILRIKCSRRQRGVKSRYDFHPSSKRQQHALANSSIPLFTTPSAREKRAENWLLLDIYSLLECVSRPLLSFCRFLLKSGS